MKRGSIIAIVILALAVVIEAIFLFQQNGRNQVLAEQLSGLQKKLSVVEKENSALMNDKTTLQNEKKNLETNISQLNKEKDSLSSKATKSEGEVKELSDKVDRATKNLDLVFARERALQVENTALNKKFMCKTTLKSVDFSSNESVNKALTEHVNNTKSLTLPVTAHYWNVIWTGDKYSIHTIEAFSEKERMTYLWKFTAYFRGESDGDHVNGIFYNDNQCWLYLDK